MNVKQLYNHLKSQHPNTDADWWPTHSQNQTFEIATGCILTQNTQWNNAEQAITNLHQRDLLAPQAVDEHNIKELKQLIKSSGYYNQKAQRLKRLATYMLQTNNVTRDELLDIKGIGKETADSILLYAYDKPYFVIDTYTRRILDHYNVTDANQSYQELQQYFETHLPTDVNLYKQYHALIVEHGKTL